MILSLMISALLAGPVSPSDYRQAVSLYDSGMYDRARTIFEEGKGDPLCEGYVLLCALKMRSIDYPDLYESYMEKYPSTSLTGDIRYENAMRLFDLERYSDALTELSQVPVRDVPKSSMPEYVFKTGYCQFSEGSYPEALASLRRLDVELESDYSAPARYLCGVMEYTDRDFPVAAEWFRKTEKDPRFSELSKFYIVDCEFNMKNYDFVIEEGEKIFHSIPKERQEHLARAISESYLVKGDKLKAREYLAETSREAMSRSDYFHAGYVLYSVDDFRGAVDNFTKMTDRSDSLGQIANYKLGNAYIRLRDKVSAMNAFKDASQVDFDPVMTEDAFFNYAKLAFDLNKDTDGFSRYIKRYSTKVKGEQIYSYMALAALYDKDYAAAVAAYDNIEELDGGMKRNYAKANYLRAAQLLKSGSNSDAVPYLRASAFYIPRNDRFSQLSRWWLAETYYKTGSYGEACKGFTDLYNSSALGGTPEGQVLPYDIAYCYLMQEDFSSAAKWFDIYARSSSAEYLKDALIRRADCDFLSKDYPAAVKSYQAAIDASPVLDDLYPYYRQGIAYGLLKGKEKAKKIDVLKTALSANPNISYYRETLYELGRAQMDAKKNTDARETLEQLLDTAGDKTWEARALIGLGMVYRNQSSYDDALDCYKSVVNMLPGSEYASDALLAIESIYQTKKQPQKYLEYVEQNNISMDKSPEAVEQMYYNTAEKVFLTGNWEETVVAVNKYLDRYPEGAGREQLKFYLAEAYKAQEEKEKACATYAEVASARKEDSFTEVAWLNYARLSYELERYQEAFNAYTELSGMAKIAANKWAAAVGLMRSAFRNKSYNQAIASATAVKGFREADAAIRREADFVTAKSFLATSRRDEAMKLFRQIAAAPSTDEGAESSYILIQDAFDRGQIDQVESMVYDFSGKAGGQNYWLARAFVVLADSFLERNMIPQAKATLESIRDGYSTEPGVQDDIAELVRIRLERIEKLGSN